MAPYAVVSLPRDGPRNPPKLLPRESLHPHRNSPSAQRRLNLSSQGQYRPGDASHGLSAQHFAGSFAGNTNTESESAAEYRLQQSAANFRQMQSAAINVQIGGHPTHKQSSAESNQVSSAEKYTLQGYAGQLDQMQSAASRHQSDYNHQHQPHCSSAQMQSTAQSSQVRSAAGRSKLSSTTDESSEGCDTAPSTISSTRDDKSSPDSGGSESPSPRDKYVL